MRVSVVGSGYVGLVSGVCLAEKGHEVVCVDVDERKVEQINSGIPPIYERGLEKLLKKNIDVNLRATTDLERAINETELSIMAVGTPFRAGEIDLKYIEDLSLQIGRVLKNKDAYHVVVVKSTVVPGTAQNVVTPILEAATRKKAGPDFGVGMNPEFLKEGEAVVDFMNPDRIILGGLDERTLDVMEELYEAFEGVDIVRTNLKTAEMVKYSTNTLLATMISFSNEIGNLCRALEGIDCVEVLRGLKLDRRLTPILESGERMVPAFTGYLYSGCGFGGSCFPKDLKALVAHGKKSGQPMRILDAVVQVNESQPLELLEILGGHLPSYAGKKVAVLGLSFKPETDDMRESPAIPVVRALLEGGAHVQAYDPVAQANAKLLFGDESIDYCQQVEEAIAGVDAIVILTRWKEFERLPELLEPLETQPIVVDGRRMLDKHSVQRYDGIGLGDYVQVKLEKEARKDKELEV